ncbi:MAG: actin-binding WH2 domain-containing protein [Chloroflexi bacterium]|nr:actin-binding WH2 domain-containing protein [Chloroflexota bacterium]
MRALLVIEQVLRERSRFFEEIRQGRELGAKIRDLLITGVVFLALYGAVMGSSHSALQALSSAAKLPLVFLVTLLVCAPTLYFFNLIFGSNQTLSQGVALMLTAIAVTAVVLLSFGPIVLFFLLTTSHYQFFKLLNVGVFTVAGIVGVVFLSQGMQLLAGGKREGSAARRNLVRLWILIYAFVGSQMAWTLRPFIGAPTMDFEFLRPMGGNFYANVLTSMGEILGFFVVR